MLRMERKANGGRVLPRVPEEDGTGHRAALETHHNAVVRILSPVRSDEEEPLATPATGNFEDEQESIVRIFADRWAARLIFGEELVEDFALVGERTFTSESRPHPGPPTVE